MSARPPVTRASSGRTPEPPLPVPPPATEPESEAEIVDEALPPGAMDGDVVDGEVIGEPGMDPLVAEALAGEDALSLPDASVLPSAREGEHGEALVPLAGGRAVLVRDALSRYLAEVGRHPRLTPEEEHDLAVRWRDQHDRDALARLVTGNLRLVVSVALSFRRAFANVLDLIQEGNLGLMEAIERFDPYKGTRLSTYATFWIRSRIVKYLLDNWRLVRVGTTNARRKLIYGLRQEKERMEREGIAPTPKLLAARMGTSEEDVVAVDRALGASDLSLDAPVGEEGDATRGDLIPGEARSPEREAAESDFRDKLKAALAEFGATLSGRDLVLLNERLLAEDPVTLQDVADREGVTREAVRQTEARLLNRLREFLADRFPDAAAGISLVLD
jgi:RNA polymerase sigma-32 factor